MLLSLKEFTRSSHLLTVQDSLVEAEILFSFDRPIALVTKGSVGAIPMKDLEFRTSRAHLKQFLAERQFHPLSRLHLEEAIRRLLHLTDNPGPLEKTEPAAPVAGEGICETCLVPKASCVCPTLP